MRQGKRPLLSSVRFPELPRTFSDRQEIHVALGRLFGLAIDLGTVVAQGNLNRRTRTPKADDKRLAEEIGPAGNNGGRKPTPVTTCIRYRPGRTFGMTKALSWEFSTGCDTAASPEPNSPIGISVTWTSTRRCGVKLPSTGAMFITADAPCAELNSSFTVAFNDVLGIRVSAGPSLGPPRTEKFRKPVKRDWPPRASASTV